MMRGTKVIEWEHRLKKVFDEIDSTLEKEYADRLPRHPARPKNGETGNHEMDGLFNVGASFSAGFGSEFGPGYVVDICISTLDRVPEKLQTELRDKVQQLLRGKLPDLFPNTQIFVEKERNHLRICGDLSLD